MRCDAIRVLQGFAGWTYSRRLITESARAFVCLSESVFNLKKQTVENITRPRLRLPSAQLAVSSGLFLRDKIMFVIHLKASKMSVNKPTNGINTV